jgi:hypothetical protein
MDLSTKASTAVAKALVVLLAFLMFRVTGFAQGVERMIDKVSWRNEPIQMVKLKTKNKSIALGRKFSEDDDWLRGLTVTVQNVSNKAIARIDIQLSFPRPAGGTSPETAIYIIGMGYGKDPVNVAANEVLKVVLPGETVDVKLLEVNVPSIKEDLEKLGYEQPIKHAQVMIRSVIFVDGSEWAGDYILYPNPNNPRQKINPKLPLEIQIPQESRSSPELSKVFYPSPGFRFLNVGLRRAPAPTQLC